tara:strand:- start:25788 stop:27992 length:2205 start_codon:yes stop_codon:yes gene_type:complete
MHGAQTLRSLWVFVIVTVVLVSVGVAQSSDSAFVEPFFPSFSTQAREQQDASLPSDFGSFGARDVTASRIAIPATNGYGSPVMNVPDLGGESGTILCYHPEKEQNKEKFPLVYYQHPTHGLTMEGWIGQNDLMLKLLASRGIVVCSPVMIGERGGQGINAAIVGGLFPGQQTSAAVTQRKVYPRLVEFAPHALTQLIRLSVSKSPELETLTLGFPKALRNNINPTSVSLMGFSAGAAIAVYAGELTDNLWPGAVKAIIALAPTIGDFTFARTQFELRAPRLKIPLLLITGDDDSMGGVAGLVELGDEAVNAPRIGVVVEGATHCHLFVPIGSQCAFDPNNDVGAIAEVGRFLSVAFLEAYLEMPAKIVGINAGMVSPQSLKSSAIEAVWGGSSALNKRGNWVTKKLAQPNFELQLQRDSPVATASYQYDPVMDTWSAELELQLTRKQVKKQCLTQVSVVDAGDGESENLQSDSSLRVFLDANKFDMRYAQAAGTAVVAFPFNDSSEHRIALILEWTSDSVDLRIREAFSAWDAASPLRYGLRRILGGASEQEEDKEISFGPLDSSDLVQVRGVVPWPSPDPIAEIMIRAQGRGTGAGEDDAAFSQGDTATFQNVPKKTKRVRLRALDLCDGGTAVFMTLLVAPPRLTPPSVSVGSFSARKVVAQSDKERMLLEDYDFPSSRVSLSAEPPSASLVFSEEDDEISEGEPSNEVSWNNQVISTSNTRPSRAVFSLSG